MERLYTAYCWTFNRKNRNSPTIQVHSHELPENCSDIPDSSSSYYLDSGSFSSCETFNADEKRLETFSEQNSSSIAEVKAFATIKWLLIRKGNLKIIESILEQRPGSYEVLFHKDHSGDTLLHIATRHEHITAMKYFIACGAEVNVKNFRGDAPLHMSLLCSQPHFSEVVNILVENGADLNQVDEGNNTFAHLCASRLSSEHFQASVYDLVDLGYANLFLCKNDLKQTPLHVAILRGLDIPLETLQHISNISGFDFNDRYSEGDTILHYAARFGRSKILLENIVALSGNWKLQNNYQKSVLHCAVAGSNIEAVEYFISLGSDINARDFLGRTPMHHLKFARRKKVNELMTLLLASGADKDAVDDCGNKAITYVQSQPADVNANYILSD